MPSPERSGWDLLLDGPNPFRGDGRYPVSAYSEFMPGPHVGRKPSGAIDRSVHPPDDPHGFCVSEYQQAFDLDCGFPMLAKGLLGELRRLGQGQPAFSRAMLEGNTAWPEELARAAGSLAHERFVALTPLALSRTLDDKGRVRWTLFGSSEHGPARAFWQSFYRAPGVERPDGPAVLERLLIEGCGFTPEAARAPGALRILPLGEDADFPSWGREPFPSWARPLLLEDSAAPGDAKALITFRPFARLPDAVRRAYLEGRIQLLPFPGALAFWGHPGYRKLARELPRAMQIPLLHAFPGVHAAPRGIRIPQSGWLNEPRPHAKHAADPGAHPHGPTVTTVKRTSRWNRTARDEDETLQLAQEDRVAHVLFSTDPEKLGLYGKPMARNAQVWTHDYRLLLDGPRHARYRIEEAAHAVAAGGHFGYRFYFPPMRCGERELYWHYPLCAAFPAGAQAPHLIEAGRGYLAAATHEAPLEEAVELWPRMMRREGHVEAASQFEHDPGLRKHTTALNVRKLLEANSQLGRKLRPSLARAMITCANEERFENWLAAVEKRAADHAAGARVRNLIHERLISDPPDIGPGLGTFSHTATRAFEERYWKQIAALAEGEFVHKDNADPVELDHESREARHLEALGNYLHERYHELIQKHHLVGKALVADHRFRWRTDFDFPWSGGWVRNQIGKTRERNVVCVIPGRNRREAVIMGDHYDTAYMEDVYYKERGGNETRRAAAGADDNHSATAALLMAADILLPMSKAGLLERDVWLVHLTGEEFPADCLGARALVQRLVEGSFAVEADGHGHLDLTGVEIKGAFILDMVAHNNDRDRYEFQISPGDGSSALRLAERAHLANERWNDGLGHWNRKPERKHPGPSKRMEDGSEVPPVVAHAKLHGDLRPGWHFKSSLYNTDAQIFSDAGIPVVLFMENYDINRTGYHDTHDTMKNIDLDYGAALVAIAIETVADVATAPSKEL